MNRLRTNFDSPESRRELKEDFPNTLARLHLRWVGDYYSETRTQARNSFRLTAVAAAMSLLALIAGIAFVFCGKAEIGKLTAAAGLIEGMISAVFFALHTRTVTKMADYHRMLILTQNVSLALKAADDLQEPERTKVKTTVIRALTKDLSKGFVSKPRAATTSPVRPDAAGHNGSPAPR